MTWWEEEGRTLGEFLGRREDKVGVVGAEALRPLATRTHFSAVATQRLRWSLRDNHTRMANGVGSRWCFVILDYEICRSQSKICVPRLTL